MQEEANAEYTDKFIAFVDILGFKGIVEESESGSGLRLPEILALLDAFGGKQGRSSIVQGGWICPKARRQDPDLDLRVTQASDCLVASAEVTPAGVINLIGRAWESVLTMLLSGHLCRGHIRRGLIYHTEHRFLGTGYQTAYQMESQVEAFKRSADERGTPFVEVDPEIVTYVDNCGDSCVKKMFRRMTKSDGGSTVLFPFSRLVHQTVITRDLDIEKERKSNNNLRLWVSRIRSLVAERTPRDEKAAQKRRHYLDALDELHALCDETDRWFDSMRR